MSIEPLIAELHSVTEELLALIDRETARLKTLRGPDLEQMSGEKSALALRYEHLHGRLAAEAEALAALPEDTKQALRELDAAFRDAAKRNLIALKARREANQRLLDTIVTELRRDQQTKAAVYGKDGRTGPSGYAAASAGAAVAVTLNKTL